METSNWSEASSNQSTAVEREKMQCDCDVSRCEHALKRDAIEYHMKPIPGKIGIECTKRGETARDLSLAYSPGVAYPCLEIAENPAAAYKYTNKRNTVAVISNGTAVLGLGNLGALASKPVMEGKAMLFKRFAGIDSFDILIDSVDPKEIINIVTKISCSFGAINLEDFKAPDCFEIEAKIKEACDIPVWHDDQHGTAVVVAAGVMNAIKLTGKRLEEMKIVSIGAGASGIACMKLLHSMGARKSNIIFIDSQGTCNTRRTNLSPEKLEFASETTANTLAEALVGADMILGLSSADIVTPEMVKSMNPAPLIFACANPVPEISPALAKSARPDAIIATGRSDYPNQVNNVLAFPFIMRGALDVRATAITENMKIACAEALANLAHLEVADSVKEAYPNTEAFTFSSDYILPKPNDPRLLGLLSAAVARAAVEDGVARLPYPKHYPISSPETANIF